MVSTGSTSRSLLSVCLCLVAGAHGRKFEPGDHAALQTQLKAVNASAHAEASPLDEAEEQENVTRILFQKVNRTFEPTFYTQVSWPQKGEANSRCGTSYSGGEEGLSQNQCQALAMKRGHAFYQYAAVADGQSNCATFALCDTPENGTNWDWKIFAQERHPVALEHKSGRCVLFNDKGLLVYAAGCGEDRVSWEAIPAGDGLYLLRHSNGQCVHPHMLSGTKEVELRLEESCDTTDSTILFRPVSVREQGYFALQHMSGRCVHPAGGNATADTEVQLTFGNGCDGTVDFSLQLKGLTFQEFATCKGTLASQTGLSACNQFDANTCPVKYSKGLAKYVQCGVSGTRCVAAGPPCMPVDLQFA